MEGKCVLITGAAQGIGFELAAEYAKRGARVVLTDINEEKVAKAADSLNKQGLETLGLVCDVTKESDIKSVIDETIKHIGKLDVLVNNAGIQHVAPIEEFPVEKFELILKIMVTAPFVAMKHAIPIMKEQKFGRILNMASINGLVGFAGKAAYNSAKHGVIGLTKVAALETAEHGITVNAICPGYVDTPLVQNQLGDIAKTRNIPVERVLEEVIYPLVPQKRLLSVKEIADYAVFLSSEQAGAVTGQAVVIDGGYTVQ
ncbi:3-hydroxybutyrate dehydrogenase [Falsibacillus albus]|uniref:3-hydroxybutyrate dehydrogenase n=1 Tax=Falsibacillus albus TaxID=2478915 RepID=A0A3L7K5E6_9BACI|nr:3-hydroxybutyrate dehydrogenase [Falsibacillus albus]RLQ97875.1 3-hydroxybutyrate dehydrogenase [Falsibacillus albus]